MLLVLLRPLIVYSDSGQERFRFNEILPEADAIDIGFPNVSGFLADEQNYSLTPLSKTTKQTAILKSTQLKFRHFMTSCTGFNLPLRQAPVNPYFLGLWLGDGDGKNSIIHNKITRNPSPTYRIRTRTGNVSHQVKWDDCIPSSPESPFKRRGRAGKECTKDDAPSTQPDRPSRRACVCAKTHSSRL